MIRGFYNKAQSTAEYAIVLALVVGAVVAMQIYVKRGLSGRMKDVVDHGGVVGSVGNGSFDLTAVGVGNMQYEPYYLSQDASSASVSDAQSVLGAKGEAGKSNKRISLQKRKAKVGWTGQVTASADKVNAEDLGEVTAPALPTVSDPVESDTTD